MIPRDEEFDVYVSEDVFAAVWRGQRVSTAQMFGLDWDGPSHALLHAGIFEPPAAPPAPVLAAPLEPPRWRSALLWLWHARVVWLYVGWLLGLVVGRWTR